MSLPVTVVALDLREIFLLFLDGGGVDTRCRRVMATTLSSSAPSAPRTSLLVVLVLLGGRSLLSGRGLFSTRRVSRGGVGGLILSTGVLLLLFSGLVPSGTSRVHVAGTRRGLEHCFCLHIDGFLHALFPGVQVMALGIQLGSDRRFKAFQEASDHDLLFWSCSGIKLSEDRLQMLQVGDPVNDFLLLVLGVSFELSPVGVHKGL